MGDQGRELGVEVAARAGLEEVRDLIAAPSFLVAPRRCQRVEDLGHDQNAPRQIDFGAAEATRVAAPVPVLMMLEDPVAHPREPDERLEDVVADLRVLLDLHALGS